jgi:hypothetical protein
MIQVKFYSIDIYDLGVRHESKLAGKLYCSVSLIRDLSDETAVSETVFPPQ